MAVREKSLQALLRYRKRIVQDKERVLSVAIGKEREIRARLERKMEDYRREEDALSMGGELLENFRRWLPFWREEFDDLQRTLEIEKEGIRRAKDELNRSHREFKLLESMSEELYREREEKRKREEQNEMDVLALLKSRLSLISRGKEER